MYETRVLLITGLFPLVLTGLRMIWLTIHTTPDHPQAIQGVLHLRGWELSVNQTIPLEGEWGLQLMVCIVLLLHAIGYIFLLVILLPKLRNPLPLYKQTEEEKEEEDFVEDRTRAEYGAAAAATESAAAIMPVDSISVYPAARLKILAVDDEPLHLKILSTMLSALEYEVVTVTSGREALARLDEEHWQLVITDIMMPHMSGYELSRLIRERYSMSELPILLLTACSRPEDIDAGFLAGANDYVTKPMDATELKSRVRALTNLKKSIGEQLRVEAAWLHAQIKPHFLFNTLNTISALGDIDTDRMKELLNVFGNYIRSIFAGQILDPVVPLEQEIELVRSYLFIEKERFDDRLQIVWEIGEPIHTMLPPLSILTLVENALTHGILARASGGTVCIRVNEHTEYVEVSISDNGVGIDEKKLKEVLDGNPNNKGAIGIRNTDQRLKQMYGKGLQIESAKWHGTKVSFKIPK